MIDESKKPRRLSVEELERIKSRIFPFMPTSTIVTQKEYEEIRAIRLERTIQALTRDEIDRTLYLLRKCRKSLPLRKRGGQEKWDEKELSTLRKMYDVMRESGLSATDAKELLAQQYNVEVKHIEKNLKKSKEVI